VSYVYWAEEIDGFDKILKGEDVLKGFEFDLKNLILSAETKLNTKKQREQSIDYQRLMFSLRLCV
jgi:hypothetical protein